MILTLQGFSGLSVSMELPGHLLAGSTPSTQGPKHSVCALGNSAQSNGVGQMLQSMPLIAFLEG